MKAAKITVIILGSLFVLVLAAGAVALSSGFQTWAVRKALAGQPDLDAEVDQVSAGFSAATLRGVRIKQPGLSLAVDSVSARYSAWAYLTGGRVDVDEIEVKGIAIDLRPGPATTTPPAKAGQTADRADGKAATTKAGQKGPEAANAHSESPEKPAAFEGLLKAARLTVELRVGRLSATGSALLPNGQKTNFEVLGADLATGAKGRLEWKVEYSDPKADAALRSLRTTGKVGLAIGATREVQSAEVDADLAASGPALPPDQLKLTARIGRTDGGDEDYAATLSILRGGRTENLLTTKARYAAATRDINGDWEIALRSEQLAALLAGFGLPEIAASGSGKFGVKPAAGAASASGTLEAGVTGLGKLSPALAGVGSVRVKSAFDGAVADNAAEIRAFSVELADGTGRTFADLALLQKAVYRLTDRRVTLPDPRADAARLTLDAVPLAWAQPVVAPLRIDGGTLSVRLAIEGEPDGSRVKLRSIAPLTLAGVTASDARNQKLVDRVTLSVAPSVDYTPARLTARLADLSLAMTTGDSLSGEIAADVANPGAKAATEFRARLQAKLVTLARPFLAFDPGALAVNLESEGRHEGDVLRLAKARAVVNRDSDKLLASFELLQALRADLKAGQLAAESDAGPTARVRAGAIPLSWAEPYVAGAKLAGEFSGATLELTLRSKEDIALRTTETVGLRGVNASLDGKPLVEGADLSAGFSVHMRGQKLAYELSTLEVRQGAAALASLTAAGEVSLDAKAAAASAKGKFDADLGTLLRQPGLAGLVNLARGRVGATFDVTTGKAVSAKAVVTARGLATRNEPRELGDIDATVTAQLKEDGSGSVSAPVTVTTSGRKSDLQVEGAFGKAADKNTRTFTGRLTSANLVADDLQAFATLAPTGGTAAQPSAKPASPATPPTNRGPTAQVPAKTTPAPAGRDTKPFWAGVNGRAEVDLRRVLYGKDYTIRAIKGTATITDTRLALDGLEGSFRDNPFKLAAAVAFNAAQPQPYALNGLMDVTGIDVGELLRAAAPNDKPMLETTVKVAAKLAGGGANLTDLIERTYGTFEVSGSKGVLRALGKKGETVSTATALIGLAGALAGGGQRVAAAAGGVSQLGRELEEMKFDGLTLKMERDAALNLNVSTIEFLSPTTRLTGRGRITHVAGKGFEQWPLQFEFRLAGKGYLQQLLNEARVLSGQVDDKGYATMGDAFTVGGTAGAVTTNLWQIVARAGLGGFLR